jgi:hypothetical protein
MNKTIYAHTNMGTEEEWDQAIDKACYQQPSSWNALQAIQDTTYRLYICKQTIL